MQSPPPAFVPEAIRPDGVRPDDSTVDERTRVDWPRVFRWLWPYWRQEALLVAAMGVGIALSLVYPLLVRRIVDEVLTLKLRDRLAPLVFGIVATTVGGLGLSAGAGWLQTWVTSRVLVDLRRSLYRHLQALGPAFFARRRLGDVLSRMGGDVAELQQAATGTLLGLLGSTFTLGAVLLALGALDIALLGVAVAFLPLALGLLLGLRPVVRRWSLALRERNADISHHMLETLQGIRDVRAHGLADREARRFEGLNEALVRGVLRLQLWSSGAAAAFQILVTVDLMAVLVVGVGRVDGGHLSAGDLVAFLMYLQRLFGPLQGLSGLYVGLQRAAAPVARVFELLDARPLREPGSQVVGVLRGALSLQGVRFGFGPQRPVLHGVDVEVPAGTTLAVIGASGVGKSTLIDLIFGFLPPDAGRVCLDGLDVAKLDPESLGRQLGLVSQQPVLFDGSLRDNVRWLDPQAGDDAVRDALDAVGLAEFVDRLPEGLQTRVGERGARLSEGQRQRIGLARALLRDPALLVLDEVTSALDWEADRVVREALARRRAAGRTTVLITHRLHAARDADAVLLLEEGGGTACGTHAGLLRSHPGYARLWALQRGEP